MRLEQVLKLFVGYMEKWPRAFFFQPPPMVCLMRSNLPTIK
jgi:hypothetical protein